jgi:hypothetical protein
MVINDSFLLILYQRILINDRFLLISFSQGMWLTGAHLYFIANVHFIRGQIVCALVRLCAAE